MKRRVLLFILLFFGLVGASLAQATSDQYLAAANKLYMAKNYSNAILYYKAAVQVNPNNWQAHQGLGSAYYALGQKADAVAEFQKALAINPGNPQLASFVQTLQAQLGPGLSSASSSVASSSSNKFAIDLMTGAVVGTSTGYRLGLGAGLRGVFPIDTSFFIGGSLGYNTFNNTTQTILVPYSAGSGGIEEDVTLNLALIEILGSVKYNLGKDKSFQPYILGGLGIALLMSSGNDEIISSVAGTPTTNTPIPSASTIDPLVQAGAGFSFILFGMDLLLEAKVNLAVNQGTFTYIPINLGVSF